MTFFTKLGTPCFHEGAAISLIQEIVSDFDPDVVIELGTKNGGFTEVLYDATSDDTTIYSYDHMKLQRSLIFRPNVHFIISDILYKADPEIIDILESDEKILLYCDNGNKQREFELYTQYLKKGDMLGVHDWGTEIFYDNVKQYLEGFTTIRRKEFKQAGFKTRFWKRGKHQ